MDGTILVVNRMRQALLDERTAVLSPERGKYEAGAVIRGGDKLAY